MTRFLRSAAAAVLALAWLLSACSDEAFTPAERAAIASLALEALPPLPPDPSNRVADDRAAAAFGATLFFDPRLSRDGSVSCATCHQQDRQFQDDLPLARAIGTSNRRTMPLAGVAHAPWQFWDGRRDSLWSQALVPLEDGREHGGNRTAFAHLVDGHFRDRYERIFGVLPDLKSFPADAGPFGTVEQQAAWRAMPEGAKKDIDTIFANLGKSLAAFERSITHAPTRFDRFAQSLAQGVVPAADARLTDEEILGLRLFVGRANCVTCHAGPRFTDDHFHNTGIPQASDLPADRGRSEGVRQALADPFNCLGPHSDASPEQCGELRFAARDDPAMIRAFKTPSLRGAVGRPPFMHSGQLSSIPAVLKHYRAAPAAPEGTTELQPLTLSDREIDALAAFLGTLDGP